MLVRQPWPFCCNFLFEVAGSLCSLSLQTNQSVNVCFVSDLDLHWGNVAVSELGRHCRHSSGEQSGFMTVKCETCTITADMFGLTTVSQGSNGNRLPQNPNPLLVWLLFVNNDNETIIAFKGAIPDFLQSLHCAAIRLQHVRSSGPGAIVCKSCATHQAFVTYSMCIGSCGTKRQLSY